MDQALYPNSKCLAGSKVIHWNYCTHMNIRKGREPGNEARCLYLSKLVIIICLISFVLQSLCHACLCLQGYLTLLQIFFCHFLLFSVFMILRGKGRGRGVEGSKRTMYMYTHTQWNLIYSNLRRTELLLYKVPANIYMYMYVCSMMRTQSLLHYLLPLSCNHV